MELLYKGHVVFIDEEDHALFLKYDWSITKKGSTSYLYRKIHKGIGKQKSSYFARELLKVVDSNVLVDHSNRNGLDNRRANLRLSSKSTNAMNSKKMNKKTTSKYKGVYFSSTTKRWHATCALNKKTYWAGYYDNEEDAARARDKKCKELHGEFAVLNFPEEP